MLNWPCRSFAFSLGAAQRSPSPPLAARWLSGLTSGELADNRFARATGNAFTGDLFWRARRRRLAAMRSLFGREITVRYVW
jgi:hypothetical protein